MKKSTQGMALTQILLSVVLGSAITIATLIYFTSHQSNVSKETLIETIVNETDTSMRTNQSHGFEMEGIKVNVLHGLATIHTTNQGDCENLASRFAQLGTIANHCENNELVFTILTSQTNMVEHEGVQHGTPEEGITNSVVGVRLEGGMTVAPAVPFTGTATGSFTSTHSTAVATVDLSNKGHTGTVETGSITASNPLGNPNSTIGDASTKPAPAFEDCPWIGGGTAPAYCSPVHGGWYCGAHGAKPSMTYKCK